MHYLSFLFMYFTGTLSSTTESVLSPNTTDELSNEFLESVGITFENHLYGYMKVIKLSLACMCTLIFLTLHSALLFSLKETVSPL